MLSELAAQHRIVTDVFATASETLGYDLWRLTQQGPQDRLNATEYTQPVMLAAGVALWQLWRAQGGQLPDMMAGHSLGEYSALVAADAIDFADALILVRLRGQLMQQAVPREEGAVAAILGLDDATVEEICANVCDILPNQFIAPVNYNAPHQVVVAGHTKAVERSLVLAKEHNAKRTMKLPMSVPVHCELMRPVAKQLRVHLEGIQWRMPRFQVLQNATLAVPTDVASLRTALVSQLWLPVQWVITVRQMIDRGMDCFVECGPGKVLSQLVRRIDRSVTTLCTQDAKSFEGSLRQMQPGYESKQGTEG